MYTKTFKNTIGKKIRKLISIVEGKPESWEYENDVPTKYRNLEVYRRNLLISILKNYDVFYDDDIASNVINKSELEWMNRVYRAAIKIN